MGKNNFSLEAFEYLLSNPKLVELVLVTGYYPISLMVDAKEDDRKYKHEMSFYNRLTNADLVKIINLLCKTTNIELPLKRNVEYTAMNDRYKITILDTGEEMKHRFRVYLRSLIHGDFAH